MESQKSLVKNARAFLYHNRWIITIPPLLFYIAYADYRKSQAWKKNRLEASSTTTE